MKSNLFLSTGLVVIVAVASGCCSSQQRRAHNPNWGSAVAAEPPRAPEPTPQPVATTVSDKDQLELKKEVWTVDKQQVSNGAVVIHKTVTSSPVSSDVTLTREEYKVE